MGFPAWANVVLASRGGGGSSRLRKAPGCVATARAAAAAEVPRLGGGAPGARRRPESLGVRGGARHGGESGEEAEGDASSAERRAQADGLRGCRGGRLCVVTLCATC